MRRSFPIILLLVLFSTACNPVGEQATTIKPTTDAPTEISEAPAAEVEEPTTMPTDPAPSPEATDVEGDLPVAPAEETTEQPTLTPTAEPIATIAPVAEPTATDVPTPEVEGAFNGQYENTYFRGSETAPVTLVDFSDFL